MERARAGGIPLRLPVDVVAAPGLDAANGVRTVGIREIPDDLMGLDIGPRTVQSYVAALQGARTIVWNGPMGVFEMAAFCKGTEAIAAAVAGSGAFSVVGGGDSVAAAEKLGIVDRLSHVSTGGGASLELLEGRVLPGVKALG